MAYTKIDHLPQKLLLKRFRVTYGAGTSGNNQNLAINSARHWLPGLANPAYTIPDGYYPVGLTYFTSGSSYGSLTYLVLPNSADPSVSDNYLLAIKNTTITNSDKNLTGHAISYSNAIVFDVLFAPAWMVEVIDDPQTQTESNSAKSTIIGEPIFKVIKFRASYSGLAAGSGKAFTKEMLGFYIPDGYEVFSLISISSGAMHVTVSDCSPFTVNDRVISIKNCHSSSSVSSTVELSVAFINKKYKEYGIRYMFKIEIDDPDILVTSSHESGKQIFDGETVSLSVVNPDRANYDYTIIIGYYDKEQDVFFIDQSNIFKDVNHTFVMPAEYVRATVTKAPYESFCDFAHHSSQLYMPYGANTTYSIVKTDIDYVVPEQCIPVTRGFSMMPSTNYVLQAPLVFTEYTPGISSGTSSNIASVRNYTNSSFDAQISTQIGGSIIIDFYTTFINRDLIDEQGQMRPNVISNNALFVSREYIYNITASSSSAWATRGVKSITSANFGYSCPVFNDVEYLPIALIGWWRTWGGVALNHFRIPSTDDTGTVFMARVMNASTSSRTLASGIYFQVLFAPSYLFEGDTPMFKKETFTYNFSSTTRVPPNLEFDMAANGMGYSIPEGYLPFSVIQAYANNNVFSVIKVNPMAVGKETIIAFRNTSSSSSGAEIQQIVMQVIFVREDMQKELQEYHVTVEEGMTYESWPPSPVFSGTALSMTFHHPDEINNPSPDYDAIANYQCIVEVSDLDGTNTSTIHGSFPYTTNITMRPTGTLINAYIATT